MDGHQHKKEYEVAVKQRIDKEKGEKEISFEFRTLREFTSFPYQIKVSGRSDDANRAFAFSIGGMTMAHNVLPSVGNAKAEITFPFPKDGRYQVDVVKKSQTNSFYLEVFGGELRLVEAPGDNQFVEFVVYRD